MAVGSLFAKKYSSTLALIRKHFVVFIFTTLIFACRHGKFWKIIATTDILIKHQSSGAFDEHWQTEATRFRTKWSKSLPAVVEGLVAPHSRGTDFFNVDLKGRLPQTTLL
jgi:hypothetical protein